VRAAYVLDLNRRFGHNIFFAGFVGFLIGILFSLTVWASNRVIQTKMQLDEGDSFLSTLIGNKFSLAITSPDEATTTNDSRVTISGTTSGKATVIISGGSSDVAIDSDGSFTTSYQLVEGVNELTISAIDVDGHESTALRSVFYTTESLQ
jgi:hypothetical protein